MNLLDTFYTVAVGFTVVTVFFLVVITLILGYDLLGKYVEKRFGEDTLSKFTVCLSAFLLILIISYEVGSFVIRRLSGHP